MDEMLFLDQTGTSQLKLYGLRSLIERWKDSPEHLKALEHALQEVIDTYTGTSLHKYMIHVPEKKCSFCGNDQHHVHHLIEATGGICICDTCTNRCREIITEETIPLKK